MPETPQFLFVTCQVGAELAVKSELGSRWPDFRLAYSRPGFLTFKLPPEHSLRADFALESVFARSYGFSLGKITGENPSELAEAVWQQVGSRPVRRIHVWPRDLFPPGKHDFQPMLTPEALVAHLAVLRACPNRETLGTGVEDPIIPAERGEFVLDCVLVEPGEWWIGFHRADRFASLWPGGLMPLSLPANAISRAWLKMEEALQWSQLPIPRGARIAEIGSAPGGASQALLAHELNVVGIDPAEMHPSVLANPNFTHLRRRASQVRIREYRKIRWLAVDMIVVPDYTLETIERIVTHPEINVRGMLINLKLSEWKLADRVPDYCERIRGFGYNQVQARQLQHNRQEICLAALMRPFVRKPLR